MKSVNFDIKGETEAQAITRIAERFEILEDMAAATKSGDIRGMIVVGPPGVGKSFGIQKRLEEESLFDAIQNKIKYEVVKGAMTSLGLYMKLFKFSDPGSVLVFDDCDTVLMDELSLNLLKAALDSGKKRMIHWNADSRALRVEGIPEKFEFKGSVIFVTNINFETIKSKKLKDHLSALQSRCHYVDLTLNTERDCFLRIKQIANAGELFAGYDFSDEDQDEVLSFIYDNRQKLREISLRMAVKIADLRKSMPNKWRRVAEVTLMRNNWERK